MAYQVDVTLQKVVCRDPESVTTGDRFVLSGAIFTDERAKAFVTPIRVLRTNESFTYNEPVFSGIAETPTVGIAFTAWDKDLNTAWVTNEPEIREKLAEIEKAIEDADIPGLEEAYSTLTYVADKVMQAIDVLVDHDVDDLLVDCKQWLQLEDVGPLVKHQRVHEILFKRSDPSGYSDWDYSLFFIISHYQITPPFPTTHPGWAEFRESSKPSRVSDWLGSWRSSLTEKKPRVRVDITAGVTAELMNVHTVEQLPLGGELSLHREGVPISRVFIDTGHRELVTVGTPFSGESVSQPLNLGFAQVATEVSVVNMWGADHVSKTAIPVGIGGSQLGADYVPTPVINVLARQQVGTDLIWLGDIVIEAYRLVFTPGAPEGVILQYMRPVTNVLYREIGAEVVLPLEVQFDF